MDAAQSPPMARNFEECSATAPLPPVSVIVPSRNEEALLADALDSVASQDYAGPMEVIVADGSDGPEVAGMIARRFPQFRVLANPQRSTSTALNLAWRAAAHEIIVRCDSHSILPPGYIGRAVRTLLRTRAANVGGLQVPLGGGTAFARALRLVGLCTGAGQGLIEAAAAAGADAFVSGEISEPTTHAARELGVHFYAGGHHATERYGVRALGAHLAERFGLEHRYIEVDNPA